MDNLPPVHDLEMFSSTAIVELKNNFSDLSYKEITHLPKGTKGWTTKVWGKVSSEWITNRIVGQEISMGSNRVPFYWMVGGKSECISIEYKELKIVKKLSAWKEVAKNGDDFMSI